jgi:hypothetical protein
VPDERKTFGSRLAAMWSGVWAKAPGILGGIALSAGLGFVLVYTPLGPWLSRLGVMICRFNGDPGFIQEVVMVYLDDSSTKTFIKNIH